MKQTVTKKTQKELKMTQTYFITGTDTDVGKTYISTLLLNQLKQQGHSTLALKPISAGCERNEQGWQNKDALKLQAAASISLPYPDINPIALKLPMAPHIAAEKENITLNAKPIANHCNTIIQKHTPDYAIIEGAGGWLVPLNEKEDMSDLAKHINCSIILVVGMRLGCLNHTLLTYESIERKQCPITGWIANIIEPDMPVLQENIETLKQQLPIPCLATIPYASSPQTITTPINTIIDQHQKK